jgi:hypothetical protein
MAIDINIPSQVKNYANLAGFPVTGSLKTIYIAEDTNKTYRWTGSAYVEISASQAASWGTITGTLSSQTDLNTALSGKQATVTLTTTGTSGASTFVANTLNVPTYSLSGLGGVPTSRTLTINGTTQDLSADRTFTISTGITIGTTAITSGTVGRVLFQGNGNVVQQSSSLFWDSTNNRLGIGTSSPSARFSVLGEGSGQALIGNAGLGGDYVGMSFNGILSGTAFNFLSGSGIDKNLFINRPNGSAIFFAMEGSTYQMKINSTGNIGINTTTDAGFKVDINGTARVATSFLLGASVINANTTAFPLQVNFTNAASNVGAIWRNGSSTGYTSFRFYNNINDGARSLEMGYSGSAYSGSIISGGIAGESAYITSTGAYPLQLGSNNITRLIIASSGNLLVNTTTDVASSKLTIESTTQGFLPPRMTTTQKNAIASPATGLMVYDTTLNLMALYNGTTWTTL